MTSSTTIIAAHIPPVAPILIAFVIAGAIGAAIGKAKGRVALGFVLGAFLGLIGWIIVGVMKPAAAATRPAVFGPACGTCGQPAHTDWSCSLYQKTNAAAGPRAS